MLCKVSTAAETAGDLRIAVLPGSTDSDATSPNNFVSNSRPSIGRYKMSVAPSAQALACCKREALSVRNIAFAFAGLRLSHSFKWKRGASLVRSISNTVESPGSERSAWSICSKSKSMKHSICLRRPLRLACESPTSLTRWGAEGRRRSLIAAAAWHCAEHWRLAAPTAGKYRARRPSYPVAAAWGRSLCSPAGQYPLIRVVLHVARKRVLNVEVILQPAPALSGPLDCHVSGAVTSTARPPCS